MKKTFFLTALILTSFKFDLKAQDSSIDFGLKGGLNYSKFINSQQRASIDTDFYKRKVGFFVGGFAAIDISEKFQFQPELLIAMQGTRVLIEDIQITTDPSSLPTISDFESNINELTISIPLVVRYFIIDTFFLEGGAQLGYVINRSENIKQNPFEEYSDGMENSTQYNYDKFEMGFAVGTGYKFSEKISLVGRFFMGLIERDNSIKSSVFNLGIEYSL